MTAASWLDSFPASDRWRDLALTHGPKVATWVLALALGVEAAVIVTDLAGGTPVPNAANPAPGAAGPGMRPQVNIAAVTSAELFGSAQVEAPADVQNAERTNLPLVLTGIIASDRPESGLAILGENATATKVYAVGDPVPGGAKLHSVYNDRVLLDRNGKVEALPLPRQLSAGMALSSPVTQVTPDNQPMVERMRRIMAEQPGAVSDIMRPQPVFAQGKQRGYRVYPGRNRQAFVRLGLRPGDLVTAINGTPLDDPQRGQEIFQTIGSSSEARITVMRNGRQQDLTLNMAQVAQEAESMLNADPAATEPTEAAPAVPPPADVPAEGSE